MHFSGISGILVAFSILYSGFLSCGIALFKSLNCFTCLTEYFSLLLILLYLNTFALGYSSPHQL